MHGFYKIVLNVGSSTDFHVYHINIHVHSTLSMIRIYIYVDTGFNGGGFGESNPTDPCDNITTQSIIWLNVPNLVCHNFNTSKNHFPTTILLTLVNRVFTISKFFDVSKGFQISMTDFT